MENKLQALPDDEGEGKHNSEAESCCDTFPLFWHIFFQEDKLPDLPD